MINKELFIKIFDLYNQTSSKINKLAEEKIIDLTDSIIYTCLDELLDAIIGDNFNEEQQDEIYFILYGLDSPLTTENSKEVFDHLYDRLEEMNKDTKNL